MYPEHLREWLADVEPTHFWFRARARLIAGTVRSHVGPNGWLELGCGSGFVLAEVSRTYRGSCVGQDVSARAVEIARRRMGATGAALYACAMDEVPRRDFDGVGCFDVIEHLTDDVAALRVAAGYVRPGGLVVVTVPAHPWLWSRVDEASGHRRRYTWQALTSCFVAAGLAVESCRPFFGALVPGLLLRRAAREREPDALLRRFLRPPSAVVNALLRAVTEFEGGLCRRGLAPFGTSWLAVGRAR